MTNTGPMEGVPSRLLATLAAEACLSPSLDEYFTRYCSAMAQSIPFDHACLAAPPEGTSEGLSPRVEFSRDGKKGPSCLLGWPVSPAAVRSYMRLAAATRQAYLHPRLKDQPYEDLQRFVAMGFGSCLQVPLLARGDVVGVLSLLGLSEGQLTRGHLELVERSLPPLSAVLHRTLLQERLEHVRGELERAERTDWLTGACSRRYFYEVGEVELSRARRYKQPLSMLFLDLDRFKDVNTVFGHDGGDQVLRHIASLLRKTLRPFDIVCRYGGEEFIILLPQTEGAGATAAARRLCDALRGSPAAVGEAGSVAVTCSIGIAAFPGDGSNLEALLQKADQAMYRAKESGGDTVAAAQ